MYTRVCTFKPVPTNLYTRMCTSKRVPTSLYARVCTSLYVHTCIACALTLTLRRCGRGKEIIILLIHTWRCMYKASKLIKNAVLRYGHENGMNMEIQTNSTEKQRVFAIFDPRKPPTRKLTKRSIFEHRFNSQIGFKFEGI